MKKKTPHRRVDVNVEELDRVIDETEKGPLSAEDRLKLRTALHALIDRLRPQTKTEKTSSVFGDAQAPAPEESAAEAEAASGHGRNGAAAYRRGAKTIPIAHGKLAHGDRCPECDRGNVYTQKEPKALVRIMGQAPLAATVYELERLRCLCRMKHRQRYAASGTMPHREFVSLRPIREQRGFARRRALKCGIIWTTVTGL